MPATTDLPDNFHHLRTLNLSGIKTSLWLNIVALFLLYPFGWLFGKIAFIIRNLNLYQKGIFGFFTSFSGLSILALLISIIIMIILHELIHALFFWLFTRAKPKFALTSGYAFAAAPNWFIPRIQYVIVGLSPLLAISILYILLVFIVPASLIPYLLLVATFNAAGAFGDMITIGWVLSQHGDILIKDEGAIFSSYGLD